MGEVGLGPAVGGGGVGRRGSWTRHSKYMHRYFAIIWRNAITARDLSSSGGGGGGDAPGNNKKMRCSGSDAFLATEFLGPFFNLLFLIFSPGMKKFSFFSVHVSKNFTIRRKEFSRSVGNFRPLRVGSPGAFCSDAWHKPK